MRTVFVDSNCRQRLQHEREQRQSSANFSRDSETQNKVDHSFMSSDIIAIETLGFVADSGSSEHMTDKRSILINFKLISKGSHSIRGIGNICLEAAGKGGVVVVNSNGSTLVSLDVLLVPGLGVNLFSISAATEKSV